MTDLTGMTAIHANRMVQNLRADGLIECDHNQLLVKDEPGLRQVAQPGGD